MLVTTGSLPTGDGWVVEPKLDGWRAIVSVNAGVSVRTPAGRDITRSPPELAALVSATSRRKFRGEAV